MTTLEIEIALMKYFNFRQNLIVPNIGWGIIDSYMNSLHECDLLVLSQANYAIEIEIKTNKYDLLRDNKKKHGHIHNYIKFLYFAVPQDLQEMALQNIPERAGLLIVKRYFFE